MSAALAVSFFSVSFSASADFFSAVFLVLLAAGFFAVVSFFTVSVSAVSFLFASLFTATSSAVVFAGASLTSVVFAVDVLRSAVVAFVAI